MRFSMLTGVLALASILPITASSQTPDADRAAVQRVVVSYAENIQAGSYAPIAALFTPGAHVLTGTAAVHGFEEYREMLQPEVARYSGLRYTHTSIESALRGDVAWANFRWQMSSAGGSPEPTLGRGTMILERINGQWMIAHVHFSK